MTKMIKNAVIGLLAIMILTIFAVDTPVKADEAREKGALLFVTEYDISNQTIIPGKEFTLKMKVENYSAKTTAKNVVVMIENPEGIVPEYGTVSVNYIDSIGPKSSKEIKFKYKADSSIEASELDFNVYISSDSYNTSTPLRIAVGREGDFSVEEFTVPEKFQIGKTEYISALIENVSGKDVDNVVMVIKCDDEILASQNIGAMSANTSKTQYVSVSFEDGVQGQHSYELLLTYTNGAGASKEFIIDSGMFTIEDNIGDSVIQDNDMNNLDNSASEMAENSEVGVNNIVIICTIGILMIAICCVILLLVYRRK